MPEVHVRDLLAEDRTWAAGLLARHLGGTHLVARLGERIDPLELEGLVAEEEGLPIGLATVSESAERGLEVVTLHADPPGRGAGSALLETAWQVAAASGHARLWLVTTNDNLDAIHFYLRRGMQVAAVHEGAVDADRTALKPEIPEFNPENGLPIRDLLELERSTASRASSHPVAGFPRIADLDQLPVESFVREMSPLVEGAPRFLRRLAEARPFETAEGLVAAAFEVGHGLPEDERIELIEAHPRIGASPESVSELSFHEQGYDADVAGDPDAARTAAELAMLNEIYEQRFGFRYVIFVAGRPRAEIVPLIEAALRNERDAELRRAVDDAIYIAADRLRALRGTAAEGALVPEEVEA